MQNAVRQAEPVLHDNLLNLYQFIIKISSLIAQISKAKPKMCLMASYWLSMAYAQQAVASRE